MISISKVKIQYDKYIPSKERMDKVVIRFANLLPRHYEILNDEQGRNRYSKCIISHV